MENQSFMLQLVYLRPGLVSEQSKLLHGNQASALIQNKQMKTFLVQEFRSEQCLGMEGQAPD